MEVAVIILVIASVKTEDILLVSRRSQVAVTLSGFELPYWLFRVGVTLELQPCHIKINRQSISVNF